MNAQLSIDFTHAHNNSESANMFEKNKAHFNKQCLKVYEALKRGERLTTSTALIKYQIGDLRRRVKDLKDIYGVDVKCEFVNGTRYKEYFL